MTRTFIWPTSIKFRINYLLLYNN
uniref:Uncharacterized protein n=1 Tax=Rhizophora mucronata TaxID=61149 RepID=A0A2P2PBH4_RHIMU